MGMTQGLRKMQDDLAEMAREWGTVAMPLTAPTLSIPPAPTFAQPPPQAAALSQAAMPALEVAARNASAGVVADVADGGHLEWLRGQREELLQSGLYSEGDPVLR